MASTDIHGRCRDKKIPIDRIGFFRRPRVSIGRHGRGLRGGDRISGFYCGRLGYSDTALQKVSLQQSNCDQSSCHINEPLRKKGEISRINSKLAIIFGDLPFGIYLVIGVIAFGVWWCSFVVLDSRRRFSGGILFVLGLVIWLSNGFAIIGAGPLGWIVWVIGD